MQMDMLALNQRQLPMQLWEALTSCNSEATRKSQHMHDIKEVNQLTGRQLIANKCAWLSFLSLSRMHV